MTRPDTTSARLTLWLEAVGASAAFEQLASLFDEAAVFVVDQSQRIVYWSPGAEALLKLPSGSVLDEHCLKASRCPSCLKGCALRSQGGVGGAEIAMFRGDGELVAVKKFARAFSTTSGEFAGGIEILLPISRPVRGPDLAEDAIRLGGLVSRDGQMHRIFRTIKAAARSESLVVFSGEPGVGKHRAALALHSVSRRAGGPFVAVDCASLGSALIDALEDERMPPAFEQARGGTLLLERLLSPPVARCRRLLELLQRPSVARAMAALDVRLCGSSSSEEAIRQVQGMGKMSALCIGLPPLRERRRDVELLAHEYLRERHAGYGMLSFSPRALRAMLTHSWPGNVRELCDAVDHALSVVEGAAIDCSDLPPAVRHESSSPADVAEVQAILRALAETDGHLGRAASLLGISRPTLWRRRKKHGI